MQTGQHAMRGYLRDAIQTLPESGIVRVFNHGRTREGLVPLWAGEGDTPTPDFICAAATEAMARGQTFYTYQRGIPELRSALAAYFGGLYKRGFAMDEFFITCGGMQAIQIALQLTAGAGDEVVIPSPAWPNFEGAAHALGARIKHVPLEFGDSGWSLDLQKLFDACSPATKVIFVNSPSNPTGWTASQADLTAILDFARQRGLWIIADEIYARFYFDGEGGLAPSFQTIRDDNDRILFVNTFSKNWAMTGWRMGWLQAPAALGQDIENLIQYNTSGVPTFLQYAGTVAVEQGEAFAVTQIARAAEGRRIVADALRPFNTVRFASPAGAFYQFFAIEGETNSLETALKLVDDANIGLAPGMAFGAAGEGYFRACFLRSPQALGTAMDRLTGWLAKR